MAVTKQNRVGKKQNTVQGSIKAQQTAQTPLQKIVNSLRALIRPISKTKEGVSVNKLYVGNLSYDLSSDDLSDLFGTVGKLESTVVIQDTDSGRSKGFGFVEYKSGDDANAALEKYNGYEYRGRVLRISIAHSKPGQGNGNSLPRVNKYFSKRCSHCGEAKRILGGYDEDVLICTDCARIMSKVLSKTF